MKTRWNRIISEWWNIFISLCRSDIHRLVVGVCCRNVYLSVWGEAVPQSITTTIQYRKWQDSKRENSLLPSLEWNFVNRHSHRLTQWQAHFNSITNYFRIHLNKMELVSPMCLFGTMSIPSHRQLSHKHARAKFAIEKHLYFQWDSNTGRWCM